MSYTPRYTNLHQILEDAAKRFRPKPLFGTRTGDGWAWTTYGDFYRTVQEAASGLAGLGVARGDRVACIANNRLEWAVCAYATYTLGATYVPMYEAQLDKDWGFILRDSSAKVCFVANRGIHYRVENLRADLPRLQHLLSFEGDDYAALLESGRTAPVEVPPPGDGDIASFIYTSGTTGQPKGVKLTHYALGANVSACLEVAPLLGEERSLAFLPWAHVFGGAVEINTLMAYGGSMAICDDARQLLDYLPEVQPTLLFAVPRVWNRVYDGVRKQVASKPKVVQELFRLGMQARSQAKRSQPLGLRERIALPLAERLVFSKIVGRFGGKLRFAFSGAAALSQEVAEFIDNLGIQVYEGYGMTECSGGATVNTRGANKLGTVGRALPGFEIKIDKGVAGAAGDEGEIVIHGTGVMAGYHGREEETRAALTDDGGLRSGDLGCLDEDGFLRVTGRVKELFKLANGKYVAPAPLEEKIQLSPYIAQCMLFGADQSHNVALIVPDAEALKDWAAREGIAGSIDQIVEAKATHDLLRAELDKEGRDFKNYECVRDFVTVAEELSTENDMLTPTFKIKRRNVMAKYGDKLMALYE